MMFMETAIVMTSEQALGHCNKYCKMDTEDIRYFREIFKWEDLKQWFENLVAEYRKWADWQIAWRKGQH